MIGYKYNTEQEAQQAIDLINTTLGIPVSPDAVTQTWTNYEQGEGFYYIIADDTIINILGEPIEI